MVTLKQQEYFVRKEFRGWYIDGYIRKDGASIAWNIPDGHFKTESEARKVACLSIRAAGLKARLSK